MQNGKHVILCVDDDKDILEAGRLILEMNDYVFEGASSAEEGLKKYKEVQPDVLIVDLMMEEVDAGINLVKELKAIGNTAPVYMLSGVGDSLHMTTDTNELGLAGVLQKPIDPDTLLATLKTRLSK